VFKLPNLEARYVADNFLGISDLLKILKALHQLTRLSFSLKPVSVRHAGSSAPGVSAFICKRLSFSRCDMIAIYSLLSHCIGLKELRVIRTDVESTSRHMYRFQ